MYVESFNIEVVKKTLDAIQAVGPERVYMSSWFKGNPTSCQTAACIAGWCALANYKTHRVWKDNPARNVRSEAELFDYLLHTIADDAAAAMNLTEEQAEILFRMKGDETREGCNKVMKRYGITNLYVTLDVLSTEPIRYFDMLPPLFRKEAAVTVLKRLLDFHDLSWPIAFELAAKACGWHMVSENWQGRIDDALTDAIGRVRDIKLALLYDSNGKTERVNSAIERALICLQARRSGFNGTDTPLITTSQDFGDSSE